MKKLFKFTSFVCILLVVIGAIWFGKNYFVSETGFFAKEAHQLERFPVDKIGKIKPDPAALLIKRIVQRAKDGKLPEATVVAGKTTLDEVKTKWGEPENSITAGDGVYIDYQDGSVSLGYSNNIIFDVRSYGEELKDIHFEDIIQLAGEADEQRYYKDNQIDQIILVYQLNETYQLKWILPRPTEKVANPTVHHISVYTEPTNPEKEEPSLVDSLTLDEKIGQMIIAGIEGTTPTPETTNLIEDYKVGGIIFFSDNLTSYSQSRNFVNGIKQINAANKIPLFLSVDQEGGRVRRLPGLEELPTNRDIGLKNDPQLSYRIGKILAKELQAFGMNMNYSPVLDVNSNPKNPVIGDRAFGDEAELVSKLGIQTMKGMEDENIIPVIKHFPGHGDTAVDSHLELPRIDKSLAELYDLELIPFINAINDGADVVMVAHILFEQLDTEYPSSMSRPIITGLLRDELGYDGVIVTDDMMMDAIKNHYEAGEAAVQSVKAGNDIILISKHYEDIVQSIEAIKAAVQAGEISEERINESVERIIALKEKYHVNDDPVEYHDIQLLNEQIKELFQ
ncbi:beta-N-acetylhexosaminidase [Paucisalibacillus globulus]|uniref:beta-N-acetylhexosaminidase n=1 Tax=Paucisalibacillus globulus TaxID=351095 RepID=UPI0004059E3D|nr:beta-N-acetylhexosaminidase [Paucisalibacillus globulus]